jgi:hypothetical protein
LIFLQLSLFRENLPEGFPIFFGKKAKGIVKIKRKSKKINALETLLYLSKYYFKNKKSGISRLNKFILNWNYLFSVTRSLLDQYHLI